MKSIQANHRGSGRDRSLPEFAEAVDDALGAPVELDEFAAPRRRPHRDQYVRYSHELPEFSTEAASRMLIRGVPLIYGGLLGDLIDVMPFGLGLGLALSAAFDVNMGRHSLLRGLYRRFVRG